MVMENDFKVQQKFISIRNKMKKMYTVDTHRINDTPIMCSDISCSPLIFSSIDSYVINKGAWQNQIPLGLASRVPTFLITL